MLHARGLHRWPPAHSAGQCSNQAYAETHAGVADADSCVDIHILFSRLIEHGHSRPPCIVVRCLLVKQAP